MTILTATLAFLQLTNLSLGQSSAPVYTPSPYPTDYSSYRRETTPPTTAYMTQAPNPYRLDGPYAPNVTSAPHATYAPGAMTYPPQGDPLSSDPFQPGYSGEPYPAAGAGCGCDPFSEMMGKFLGDGCTPNYMNGYYDPFSNQFAYGSLSFTPYQLSWSAHQEILYTPPAPTQDTTGDFGSTEWNGWTRYAFQTDPNHLFTFTLVRDTRFLSGPTGVALGPRVNSVKGDFQIASNDPGPWNWQLGITPQIGSDLERQLSSDAYMLDARAVVFYKFAPQLTLAWGVAYWDRNDGHIIPYGGIVWAPDDRWEFRAMFPKSRISYFAGSLNQSDIWLYGSMEYNIEAYEVTLQDPSRLKQRMELQDYRFMLGITAISPQIAFQFEGGYITDRHADFRGPTQDFGIGDTWIVRAGVTF